MNRLIVICLASLLLAGSAFAASPDPKSLAIPDSEMSRARELVRQLGSEQYAVREKAEAALAQMGRLARPALLEGVTSDPSQEVRTRCTGLLPKATSLEMRARLDVFLADVDGEYEHDLPGWNQFRFTVRKEVTLFGLPVWSNRSLDRAARGVFAGLISSHANRKLVMATGGADSDLGQLVADRRQELYSQKYPRAIVVNGMVVRPMPARDPSAEDLAALLFAESHVPARFVPRTSSISSLITSSGFSRAAHDNDDKGKVYRAIAVAWLDTRSDPIDMYQSMTIASNLGMPDQACRLGVRLLTAPGAVASYRGLAANNLVRLGNKDLIPQLEKALADKTVAYTVRKNIPGKPGQPELHDVQVRDMALAISIIHSGQKIEDYGFVDNLRSNTQLNTYSYSRHYIPEEKRAAMFEKWKAWREKNP